MFCKFLIFLGFFVTGVGCWAADMLPQVVTSEVFYSQQDGMGTESQRNAYDDSYSNYSVGGSGTFYSEDSSSTLPQIVTSDVFYYQDGDVQQYENSQDVLPAWPLAGSDADVEVGCADGLCSGKKKNDSVKIVSKIGTDLVVENNFNLGRNGFGGWSGGANMLHGTQIPVGFADECASGAEMPLLHREVLEDDGGNILAVSRSGRKNCAKYADSYLAFATKNGMKMTEGGQLVNEKGEIVDENGEVISSTVTESIERTEIAVDISADAEAPAKVSDQVRSWVVASGQTLREVLQDWCNKEGWDLVWATSREYPIEASAIFKGRFTDVAAALVRNFGRVNPIPYAKFYKGNRVLVVTTSEE